MGITTYRQNAFNAGELSPRLKGRTDIEKYQTGLQTCENGIVLPGGGVTRRPGFRYINEVKDSSKYVELVPFEFSEDQAYVLEFGDTYMRVYMDGGRVTTPDANTKLIMHFDGDDGSISITDNGVTGHTVSCFGNAKLDTDYYVFPTASCIFDGNGDYLSIPDHADWDFSTDELTIDFRVRFYANSGISTIWLQKDASNADRIWFFVDHEQGTICLQVVDGDAMVINEYGTWAPSVDTWYHVALIRGWGGAANDWAICVNGTAIHTFTNAGTMPNHDQVVKIGGGPSSTTFYDFSDEAHVLTANNGVTLSSTQAKFGDMSIYCDGSNDFISSPDHADWDVCSTANSSTAVELWARVQNASEGLVSQWVDSDNCWSIRTSGTGAAQFYIRSGASTVLSANSIVSVADSAWHHILMQKSGNYYGVWVDGVQEGLSEYSGNLTLAGTLRVGHGYNDYFTGYIEDVRVGFDDLYTLSPQKPWLDSSGAAHGYATHSQADNNGSPTGAVYKWGNGSYYFDGSNDYIKTEDHADFNLTANTTIDLWVKHITHADTDGYIEMYEDLNNHWVLYHVHGYGLRFKVVSGAAAVVDTGYGGEITDTDWHHIAMCKVGNEYGIYKDGVQVAYVNDSSTDTFTGSIRFGHAYLSASHQYFNGYIDEARITHANSFSAAPDSGLTDTITVPTAEHTSDGDTELLMHFDQDQLTPPTTPLEKDSNTKLLIRADATDFYGWLDEFRVSTTARWTTTFSLPTQEYPAGGGGTTYEIVTPYSYLDVFDLRVVQSTDTLYIFHKDYSVRKLTRTDHDSWTITEVDWAEPPWNSVNTTATTLDPSAVTGTGIDVVASAPFFADNHVGAYFKQANGYYKITSVTDSQNAVADVKDDLDNHNATSTWYQGAWDPTQEYPSMGVFHEDRLVVIEGSHPLTVYLSETGDYENFGSIHSPLEDDDPCSFDIMARTQNKLQWIEAGKKLFLGSHGGEFWMTGESIDLPITPTSVLVRRETTFGGEPIQPLTIGHYLFFIQKDGKRIREWGYSNDDDAYVGIDLSILAEHFTKDTTVKKIQYAQDPHGLMWVLLDNGYLLGMTYLKEHKVIGFHIHDTGLDGIIESIAVIPGTYGDELWAVICRDVGGSDYRFVEKLEADFFGGDLDTDPFFLDCALSYTGSPATDFDGMDHLEGETVKVFADGEYVGEETISSGGFTLSDAASYVVAGIGYNTNLQTLVPDVAQKEGSDGCSLKRIIEATYQVYETCNFKFGRNSSNLIDMDLTSGTLYSGEYNRPFNGEHSFYPSIYIRQDEPTPFTLLSISYKMESGDE